MKEKGTCGSLTNEKKKKRREEADGQRATWEGEVILFFFSLLSSIYGNRTDGIRRGKKKSALLDEGYAWEQKTRDFAKFSIKNSENLMFWFFSDLRLSNGQNWSDQEAKLIHASRAMREYQNIGVSSNYTRYEFSSKYVNKYVYDSE